MYSEKENLDIAQKLMLLQGIDLIHNGIQFIEWAEDMPNELSYDFFTVLIERFNMLRESVLDGSMDNLIIDRIKSHMEDVNYGSEIKQEMQAQLALIRKYANRERHQKKKDKQ